MRISEHHLRGLATSLLEHRGAPPAAAWLQADLLIEAELRNLPSHGLQRLPLLLARIDRGLADPSATGTHRWRKRGLLEVEGQRALGPVALMAALEALAPAIEDNGLALAAIRDANHIGMLAYYVEQAALRGLIGIVFSTSEALVHPFGGTKAVLGTNPIAIGIPTGKAPFVLDLATSLVPMGKIHNQALRGENLQPGWAVDADGNPTIDPEAAKSGAIAPFGGAKGYGLGLAFGSTARRYRAARSRVQRIAGLAGRLPPNRRIKHMPNFGTIRAPREIIFGSGQRKALGPIASRLGHRALIVTDARMAADSDFLAMIADLDRTGLSLRIESGTLPDVPVDTAIAAAEAARGFAPDLVIGIGGGSCLDMAKCVALLLTHGGKPQEYYGELKVPGPTLPLIAVPTTAGTGSEVTPVAVLSDAERSLKVGVSSPHLIPAAAICDPDLTLTCPAGLTAIAGADALTHALEAFTATRRPITATLTQERVFIGKNAISDQFALTAIALLWQGLEIACRDGGSLEARSKVMQGATFAGLAFGVAGTAAAHAIQYPVGALTHTPHGAGVACLMPWVMEWNRPAIGAELAEIATVTGLSSADEVIPAIAALFTRIGIPPTLKALGLAEDRLDWVAEQSCGIERLIQNNPRPIDRAGMIRLLQVAFSGDLSLLRQPEGPIQ